MGLFDIFSRKGKSAESVVLIDIGATSVAGAYAHYIEGQPPILFYTRRLPIEIRTDEPHERAMLRALEILGNDLIREGAPVLARATGSGSASMILVSIDAPWQETAVRTEDFEEDDQFTFTKSLVTERLEKTGAAPSEKMLANESIIGTILNGYETRSPYGKKVYRASVIVLTSLIERAVADSIIATLGRLYHTKNVMPISGSSLRYQTMRDIFPHEQDAIILDATGGSLTSIALVRRGLFVTLIRVDTPSDDPAWVSAVTNELAEIAKHYPLPRTIFLLAREPEISSLQQTLSSANLGSLWLSDNPPKFVPVLKNHIIGSIQQTTSTSPDIVLLFMALYYQTRVIYSTHAYNQ